MSSKLIVACFLFSVLNGLSAQETQINNSFIAFTVPEKDLLPENIAYSSKDQAFYIGSTRKGTITKIDRNGKHSTFIESGEFGQWMVIGMKINASRNELWFCSSGGENLVGYEFSDDKEGRPAGVFRVNLETGELIKKYVLDDPGEVHFFNDLVIARNGDVYVTHMFGDHAIYRIGRDSDRLELLTNDASIKYPNGISMADNQSMLFVAHSDGLARIDLESKKVTALSVPDGVKVTRRESIDGLYYYRWSLIGVQSDLKQITRYYLNEDGTGIERVEILEKGHPMMDHPTTGTLVNGSLYYIANSQFERFDEQGNLFPTERLIEPVILKVALK